VSSGDSSLNPEADSENAQKLMSVNPEFLLDKKENNPISLSR